MRAAIVSVSLLLGGCAEDPPSPPPCECGDVRDDDPVLEIGEGSPSGPVFEPLAADAELELESGSQGGYHVYLGLRTKGICTGAGTELSFVDGGMHLERFLRVAGDDLVHRTMLATVRTSPGDDRWSVVSRAPQTFVCPATQPMQIMHGAPLEVEATATESGSCVDPGEGPRSATATATFVAVCPDGDEICTTDDVVGCDLWEGD